MELWVADAEINQKNNLSNYLKIPRLKRGIFVLHICLVNILRYRTFGPDTLGPNTLVLLFHISYYVNKLMRSNFMKKLFIANFIVLLIVILSVPVFAQNIQNQLNRYVSLKLNDVEKEDITKLDDEEQENLTYEEIKSILESIIDQNTCQISEVAQDLSDYINENALFSATGKSNEWEERRSELYHYVQSSDWRTKKDISDADRAFRETLNTIAFGFVKETAQLCGWDRILDRLEQEAINKYENNESIQNAIASVAATINDAINNEDNTTDVLYIKVQHNAFNLLTMSYVDFNKLIKKYPEVEFLFEDMYTFFKWRYELRTAEPSYKLNENNINVEFRLPTSTNSFFAFWELANIAKAEIKNAIANNNDSLITLSVSDERDNMKFFDTYAKQALYFGQIWNGMQRYAAKKGIIPEVLNPKRAARKVSIKKAINDSFSELSDEQILSVLDEIRSHYISARSISEHYWQKWASVKLTERKNKQFEAHFEKIFQQIQKTADTLKTNQQQNVLWDQQ